MTTDNLPALNGAGPPSALVHGVHNGAHVAKLASLYSRALMHLHGGERGAWMPAETVDEIAHDAQPAVEYGQTAAFVIASSMYEPTQDPRDPVRAATVRYLVEHLGVCRRAAYYACEQVDLVALLSIPRTGPPTIQHLNEIVRSGLGRGGWGQVNGWVIRKRGFARVSAEAVADKCQKLKDEAKAEAERRAAEADPHDPAEAEEVDAEPVASEPADDEPAATTVLLPSDNSPYSQPKCDAEFLAAHEIGFGLAYCNNRMLDEAAEGAEEKDLRKLVDDAMIELDRPPERISPYLDCPRSALVRALKGLAEMMRKRVGLPGEEMAA